MYVIRANQELNVKGGHFGKAYFGSEPLWNGSGDNVINPFNTYAGTHEKKNF